MSRNYSISQEAKQSRYVLTIVILSLLVVGLGVKVIIDSVQKTELKEVVVVKSNDLSNAYFQLDSIGAELTLRIEEIQSLGGRVDSLLVAREELEQEKEAIRNGAAIEISSLKARVAGYTKLLYRKDREIVRLKKANQVLLSENTGLKTEKVALERSIEELNTESEELKEKVFIASQLSIENVSVKGVSKKGKETSYIKASKSKGLRISFDVLENPVADADNKEILLRILNENGKALFDVSRGGGSFMHQERELFYTLKKTLKYEKRTKRIGFAYQQKEPYTKGLYTVEAYTEGYLMGKGNFRVR